MRKDKPGRFSVHNSYGVFSTTFDGILFNKNAVVSNAYPQKDIGRSVRLIIDQTISNKVQFLLSDTPFHYGVPGGVSCETILQSLR